MRLFFAALAVAMAAMIVAAWLHEPDFISFWRLLYTWWGATLTVDFLLGVIAIACLMWWAEGGVRAVPWIVALVFLGNIVTMIWLIRHASLLRRRLESEKGPAPAAEGTGT